MLEGKHVFVVEDNAANLAVISAILRHNGAILSYERWGHNTISRMDSLDKIDIILLDLSFPRGITGYDIFETIKASENYSDIPIVAVTASDPDVELRKVQEYGFDGFICKPIQRHVFPEYLEAIINGHKVWIDELV